jgi:hypothetical protein
MWTAIIRPLHCDLQFPNMITLKFWGRGMLPGFSKLPEMDGDCDVTALALCYETLFTYSTFAREMPPCFQDMTFIREEKSSGHPQYCG